MRLAVDCQGVDKKVGKPGGFFTVGCSLLSNRSVFQMCVHEEDAKLECPAGPVGGVLLVFPCDKSERDGFLGKVY